ncbi:hypothetical protein CcI49_20810 [Frankia sp. CcI49]|uniref:hypothetical protein n=1 Tax=Frankia sp. CcI49 TaxID=1745382 RepID=UPI0009C98E56|nr:hypothetical protein [Frankia sp. CcI49]ONH58657.1 hypothetical protein CcI49_20810 [Frankia sp. CcI49]
MTAPSSASVVGSDPLASVAAIPGVDEAATAARAGVDALLRHRILRRRSAEVTAEASLRAARASAALEGHDVPLDVLRAHLGDHELALDAGAGAAAPVGLADGRVSGPADGTDSRSLAVTLGAVRLYAELGTLSSAWERAPRQALARMHVLAGRGLLPDEVLGRPRVDVRGPGAAVGTAELAGPWGEPRVSAMEMSVRLDGLTAVLTAPTRAPAIVVAAIIHGELLAIRPFGVLDGIIARAAARLVLISRGLDPKALVATDVGHLELAHGSAAAALGGAGAPSAPSAASAGTDTGVGTSTGTGVGTVDPEETYSAALAAYVAGGADGVGSWVRHCARAVGLAARESLAVCEALSRA